MNRFRMIGRCISIGASIGMLLWMVSDVYGQSPVTVSLPDTSAPHSSILQVPVRVTDTTDRNVVSVEFSIAYDSGVVTPQLPGETSTTGTLTAGWFVVDNVVSGAGGIDTLVVAMTSIGSPTAGAGVLIYLNLVTQDIRQVVSTPLEVVHLLFNDGDPPSVSVDGSVTIMAAPGTPVLVDPSDGETVTNLQVQLLWRSVLGATQYRLEGQDMGGGGVMPVVTSDTSRTAMLTSGHTYRWRVRGENAIGNGRWSSVWTFLVTTDPPAQAPVLTSPSDGEILVDPEVTFLWRSILGATSYRLEGGIVGSGTSKTVTVSDTTYTVTLPAGQSVRWRVRGQNANGNGPWSVIWDFSIQAPATKSAVPTRYVLLPNRPNPFNPETTIAYDVPRNGTVHLAIYSITGQHVRTLVDERHAVGAYTVTWDGTDEFGQAVASGVYLCQMNAGSHRGTQKMLLVR